MWDGERYEEGESTEREGGDTYRLEESEDGSGEMENQSEGRNTSEASHYTRTYGHYLSPSVRVVPGPTVHPTCPISTHENKIDKISTIFYKTLSSQKRLSMSL